MKTRNPITFAALSLMLCATAAFAAQPAQSTQSTQSTQPQTIEDIINTQISYQSPSSINSGTGAAASAAAAQDAIDNLINAGADALAAASGDQQNHAAAAAASTANPRAPAATPPASPMVAPYGLALDESGNLYVADSGANVIWKITNDSKIARFAGSPNNEYGSANGKGTAARFDSPLNLVIRSGTLYLTDSLNNIIRVISPDGTVRTLAGSPTATTCYNEGTGAKAAFYDPVGIAVDSSGKLYVVDRGNSVIRKITTAGLTSWLAGEVHIPGDWSSFTYTGGASFNNSVSISSTANIFTGTFGVSGSLNLGSGTFDLNGNVLVSDTSTLLDSSTNTIPAPTAPQAAPMVAEPRVFDDTIPLPQIVTTATETYASGTYSFYSLFGMTVSPDGNYLYVCNTDPAICAIKISDGTVIPLDTAIFGSEDNPLRPVFPRNLRFDSQGNLYIADTENSRILKVDAAAGSVACIAGGMSDDYGYCQSGYQDGPGADALFNAPTDIVIDNAGNIYVADKGNGVIRKIDASNNVTTLALEEVALALGTSKSGGAGSGDGGGGGGGAPSPWYLLALATLVVARPRRR